MVLREISTAILLAGGHDPRQGTRWWLHGLPGNVYFTVEMPERGPRRPMIIPCDYAAAVCLYDDATQRYAATLDVERAVRALRKNLGADPSADA
jgi:hypothetical protein